MNIWCVWRIQYVTCACVWVEKTISRRSGVIQRQQSARIDLLLIIITHSIVAAMNVAIRKDRRKTVKDIRQEPWRKTFFAVDLLRTKRCTPVYNNGSVDNGKHFSMKVLTVSSNSGINVLTVIVMNLEVINSLPTFFSLCLVFIWLSLRHLDVSDCLWNNN